jgi:hypothetical protein
LNANSPPTTVELSLITESHAIALRSGLMPESPQRAQRDIELVRRFNAWVRGVGENGVNVSFYHILCSSSKISAPSAGTRELNIPVNGFWVHPSLAGFPS